MAQKRPHKQDDNSDDYYSLLTGYPSISISASCQESEQRNGVSNNEDHMNRGVTREKKQKQEAEKVILHTDDNDNDNNNNNYNDKQPKKRKRGFKLRPMKKKDDVMSARTNDDIHTSVRLSPAFLELLDTPQVQRLRSLRQLGLAEHVFVNVTHNRLEHSLGVAHLAEIFCKGLQSRQPQLGIVEKDVLCVKIAGLCHDLGHGPFSHVYDGEFRDQLRLKVEEEQQNGVNTLKEAYRGQPELPKTWKHELGSLTMLDAALKHLGLQIDWNQLDKPLKQIGDGIDANCFGLCTTFPDGQEGFDVLTSRDWIFIKECIYGKPLPKDHRGGQYALRNVLVGREQHPHKEFLYDIVNNRHCGLDVDKMDYLSRDERHAFGTSGTIDIVLMEEAYVAWGKCPSTEDCFRCRNCDQDYIDIHSPCSDDEQVQHLNMELQKERAKKNGQRGMHLMICYPEKIIPKTMDFFQRRFKNYSTIYTHKTAKAAEYMICDILRLADPYVRIPIKLDIDEENNDPSRRWSDGGLAISRAMLDSRAYLELDDSIIRDIAKSRDPRLIPAQKLIDRFRSRDFYKCVGAKKIRSVDGMNIHTEDEIIWQKTEHQIITELVAIEGRHQDADEQMVTLTSDDIIVDKREIHHGWGAENPVSRMRFFPKWKQSLLRNSVNDLPEAVQANEEDYGCHIPRVFLERTLRVFCRGSGAEVELLTHCFSKWLMNVESSFYTEEYGSQEAGGGFLPICSQESVSTPVRPRDHSYASHSSGANRYRDSPEPRSVGKRGSARKRIF